MILSVSFQWGIVIALGLLFLGGAIACEILEKRDSRKGRGLSNSGHLRSRSRTWGRAARRPMAIRKPTPVMDRLLQHLR